MPGSQDRWDQLEDPRESTVDLPRLAGMSRLERPSNGDTAADQPLPEYHPGSKDPLPRTGEPAVPPEDPRSMLDHAEPTEPEDPDRKSTRLNSRPLSPPPTLFRSGIPPRQQGPAPAHWRPRRPARGSAQHAGPR